MKPQDEKESTKDNQTKKDKDKELDEALKESFPASDAPSMTQPDHKK